MPRNRLKRNVFVHSLFFLVFVVLASYITFPLVFKLTSLTTGYGDELFIAWNHAWNIHTFFTNPVNILHIFNAPLFFPYQNTLAYSDAYLTNSLLLGPIVLLLKEPIATNNLTLILSFIFLGFFTYLLSFYLTKDHAVSFVSGILVQFCPVMLTYLVHIQILASYLVPLSIIFFLEFLKTKKALFYLLFLFIFILQMYNSFLPGYFIFFTALILIIFYGFSQKNYKWIFDKRIIFLSLISFLMILPVITPYFSVSKQFNYTRDFRETIHFALQPEDFITTISQDRFFPLISKVPVNFNVPQNAEIKQGFIGLTFLILLVLSISYFLKRKVKKDFAIKGIITSAFLGFILSLGPFLHLGRLTIHHPFPIPLPYAAFYYLVPGFKGMRNSAPWEMLLILFSAVVIGYFLHVILKKNNYKKYFICIVLSIVIILEFNPPLHFLPVPPLSKAPKLYSWLKTTPATTSTIEMPIYNWNMQPYVSSELWREYYSTIDFRPAVNGTSGFTPPPWQNMVINLMSSFPSDATVNQLNKLGVNLIIIHKAEYDKLYNNHYLVQNKRIPNGTAVINFLASNPKVELVKILDNDYVYRLK